MSHRPYTKPYASPSTLAAHLISCGLPLRGKTRAYAERKIETIGYERLRIYLLSRRNTSFPNKPFQPDVTFRDIVSLYEFDERLRAICLLHTGRFEIALRNRLSEHLSQTYDPHPFFDEAVYKSVSARKEALASLSNIFYKKSDPRAQHYFTEYNPPMLPPIWVLKEFMTFGNVNYLLDRLSKSNQKSIANIFLVSQFDIFESWVKALIDLRNICAHHDRLFNRSLPKQPKGLQAKGIPSAPRNKLKALLQCLDYLLSGQGYNPTAVADVGKLIAHCSAVHPYELGY